jgi:hypothetical protein
MRQTIMTLNLKDAQRIIATHRAKGGNVVSDPVLNSQNRWVVVLHDNRITRDSVGKIAPPKEQS